MINSKQKKSYFSKKGNKKMIRIKNIPITFVENYTREQIETIMKSHKLINYIDRNISNKNVKINSIRIDKVNFFGKNVGFIYLEADIEVNGAKVPGIAFIRGDSVAILLVLNTINKNNEKEKYSIMVEQYRANIGKFTKEIPAGMIDEEGQVISTAIKEIEEEVGQLNITKENLTFITKYAPSAGGCDENISIYVAEIDIEYDTLMDFQDKITGAENENESIKLDVVKFKDIPNYGMKAQIAYGGYLKKRFIENKK